MGPGTKESKAVLYWDRAEELSGSFPGLLPSGAALPWRVWYVSECQHIILPSVPGLRNPPRPLLVAGSSSTGSGDSDGGLFAVPTTLPPNSRHGKLFSPSKEAELTFRQHLDSISVSAGSARLGGYGVLRR